MSTHSDQSIDFDIEEILAVHTAKHLSESIADNGESKVLTEEGVMSQENL